ncbi:MAG: purine-nucleoside phosphorylase [Clostridia bacterium]|jgi:purine-nucleoside phosphorylase|nr:purine-nucleoside phosphorylase [Clostridia bacterium]
MEELKMIKEASEYISNNIKAVPSVALVLGSGLGDLAEEVEEKTIIKYSDIPNFPVSTVEGHKGQLVFGKFMGKDVVMMQGRFHFYEGYTLKQVTFPIRVFKNIGIDKLIVTNAAGATNKEYNPGDLVILKDHINMLFESPLRGKNLDEFGPRFSDMTNAYDKELRQYAKEVAGNINIDVREGVYACMGGPTYETPAEVRMIGILGADVVGMSTVPEVIVANHSGMKVLGISCATNMAAGILDQPLNHEEVLETSARVKSKFSSYMKELVKNL